MRNHRPAFFSLRPSTLAVCFCLLFSALVILSACQAPTAQPTEPGPTASSTPSPTPLPSATLSPTPAYDPSLPAWQHFAAPQLTPVTPVPPPATALQIPDEVQVLALLGTDQKSPFVGRTDAILLVFYHPRFSRASLLSIPPDLMVYIPGYTMQRLQIAFALGGIRQFNTTLEYNFGLRAKHYALVHLDDFSRLVDDLHGVEMPVWTGYPDLCGGIPQGNIRLYGDQALCYIRLRLGEDEASRNNRQQEMLRQLFMAMVQNGNLVRIPELYTAYRQTVDSDMNLNDLLNYIPLALKLGDPNRMGFFYVQADALTPWIIPASTPAVSVFLPDTQKLLASAQEAVNFVLTPAPLSDRVLTYEAALTSSPSPTITLPATITLTPTIGPSPTRTITNTPGPTLTPSLSPTAGPSPTRSLTPTPGDSPTPTSTVEGYPIS